MGTPKPSRPPFGQSFPGPAINEIVAGELWTIRKDGEDWPVVICDEAVVWTFFKDRVRPFSARKADGTWPELYESGGPRVGQRSYPTVILGQLKFTWVTPKVLLDRFDMGIGEGIRDSTKTPLLAQGCREAMRLYAMEDPLPELKKAIHKQRLERGHPKVPIGSDDIASIKRKGKSLSKNPCSMEQSDDEEPEACGFQQESSAAHKIKEEPRESGLFVDMNVFEGSTDLTGSDSEQPHKKSRLDSLGRSSMRPSTPLRAATQGMSLGRMPTSRDTPALSIDGVIHYPNRVIIYVDNPHVKYNLTRSALAASPLLSKMVAYHPNDGWYVMAPVLSQLNKMDFFPVGQYLERGEYDPNILDEGTDWVRLETNVSGQDAGGEVMRCATIYDIAGKLEIAGLHDLVFRKLKALAKNEPHQPSAILRAVDIVFKNAQPDMRQYLVEYLAEQFYDLMTEENILLVGVIKGNDELRKKVFRLLGGPPEIEIKNEAEGKMKEEELFDEAKGELESPNTVEDTMRSLIAAQKSTSQYHATVATATDEDPPEEDKPARISAEEQSVMRMTARDILTEDDIKECNALDDEEAAREIAATLPYPLPAVLPAEIDEQMREGLGDSYESVKKFLGDMREEDVRLTREEDARFLEG